MGSSPIGSKRLVVLIGKIIALHVIVAGSSPAESKRRYSLIGRTVVSKITGVGSSPTTSEKMSGSLMVKPLAHNEGIAGSSPARRKQG